MILIRIRYEVILFHTVLKTLSFKLSRNTLNLYNLPSGHGEYTVDGFVEISVSFGQLHNMPKKSGVRTSWPYPSFIIVNNVTLEISEPFVREIIPISQNGG